MGMTPDDFWFCPLGLFLDLWECHKQFTGISKPKIEVHISNIYKREEFRKKSVTAESCDAVISGFGMKGYRLALQSLR